MRSRRPSPTRSKRGPRGDRDGPARDHRAGHQLHRRPREGRRRLHRSPVPNRRRHRTLLGCEFGHDDRRWPCPVLRLHIARLRRTRRSAHRVGSRRRTRPNVHVHDDHQTRLATRDDGRRRHRQHVRPRAGNADRHTRRVPGPRRRRRRRRRRPAQARPALQDRGEDRQDGGARSPSSSPSARGRARRSPNERSSSSRSSSRSSPRAAAPRPRPSRSRCGRRRRSSRRRVEMERAALPAAFGGHFAAP